MIRKYKVYLAGPEVFGKNSIECGFEMKKICKDYGLEGLYPMDNEIPFSLECESSKIIYDSNIEMIEICDAVIANITPFRGPHMDVGTAFEIGYARALRKPTILWSEESKLLFDRIPTNEEGRDKDGNSVENFNLVENLMITPSRVIEVHHTFEAAVKEAAQLLNLLSCLRVV